MSRLAATHGDERAEDGVGPLVVDPPGVMRLSTMLDCWKNSCHGATVVPTMAMTSSTDVELKPPLDAGDDEVVKTGPAWGWAEMASGMTRKLATMKTNMKRSQRRKLPAGGHGHQAQRRQRHRDVGAHPEVAEGQADPDELGDDGEEVQDEEVADREGAPEPAEALVDEPGVADAGTAPRRTTISWLTTRTGMSRGSVHSRVSP